jgi:hypothetical protein
VARGGGEVGEPRTPLRCASGGSAGSGLVGCCGSPGGRGEVQASHGGDLQALACSGMFIPLLNFGLTGVVATLVALALKPPGPLVGTVAAPCGLSFLGAAITLGSGATTACNDG